MNIDELLAFVAKRSECSADDIEWYAWPQVFGTTAGPRGCGGNMMTAHQVYAFCPPIGEKVMYCSGVWRRWNGEFKTRF